MKIYELADITPDEMLRFKGLKTKQIGDFTPDDYDFMKDIATRSLKVVGDPRVVVSASELLVLHMLAGM